MTTWKPTGFPKAPFKCHHTGVRVHHVGLRGHSHGHPLGSEPPGQKQDRATSSLSAPVLGDPPPPPLPKEAWSARCLSVQTPCPAAPVQDSGLRVSEALPLMVPSEAAAGRPPHPSLSVFSPSLVTLPCLPPGAGHRRTDLPALPVSLLLSVSDSPRPHLSLSTPSLPYPPDPTPVSLSFSPSASPAGT